MEYGSGACSGIKNVGFFMLAVCGAVFIRLVWWDPEKVKQEAFDLNTRAKK